jgi:hypothetical protein
MLDTQAQGVIAEGDPHRLSEKTDNPVVHRFFHREAA